MTIKKLTVAAAIAVGIATCSFSSAMAACPCSSGPQLIPVPTGAACPCQQLTTPENAPCPNCGQPRSSCHCGCPAQAPCGCSTPCAPCAAAPIPTCTSCASTPCGPMDTKQVYAYPALIFGENYYVGQQNNSIYSTWSAFDIDNCDKTPVAALGVPVMKNGQILGAAMPINGCGCAAPMQAPCGCGCGSALPATVDCGCPLPGCQTPAPAAPCGCAAPIAQPCGCGCAAPCAPELPIVTGYAAPCGCGCVSAVTDPLVPNCMNTNGAIVSNGSTCGCGGGSMLIDPISGLFTGLGNIVTAPFNWLDGSTRNVAKLGCPSSLQTCDSMPAIKRALTPFTMTASNNSTTGAAAPMVSVFPDIPTGYWAGCAIDRLAATNVIAGYPDRTFKPQLPVSRAEFASIMVKGLNLNLAGCECLPKKSLFKDVPSGHWANPTIAKAVQDGIMAGYTNNTFKPSQPVTRVEALTALAHGINCDMDSCKAKEILSQYCDGDKVPSWAEIPVAKALQTGVLKCSPSPNTINPCKDASRADIASMMQTVRIAAGYDKDTTPTVSTNCDCGCTACAPKTAYMQTDECVRIPTLKLEFMDEINAKSSHVGQYFGAKTLEPVTINGTTYPCGSKVNGKVVEVIRPTGCRKGALKLAFTSIQGCNGCRAELPRQILTAQVECNKTPNIIAKIVTFPFSLAGTLLGTAGRTVGGVASYLGNASEHIADSTGIAFGDVFQGAFPAAGRSILDAAKATVMAPIDAVATTATGVVGLVQTSVDEVAYLVTPNGFKVSAVNPREHVTIAFGCAK